MNDMNTTSPAIVKSVVYMELNDLAFEINSASEQAELTGRKYLERCRESGAALLKAKEKCGHGNWMAWHEKNIKHSYRTSMAHIAVAENWPKLQHAATLRDALQVIADHTKDESDQEDTSTTSTKPTPPPAQNLGTSGPPKVVCSGCARRARTGQPPLPSCKECKALAEEGPGDAYEGDPDAPPAETRPAPSKNGRSKGGKPINGCEKWSIKEVKDNAGKLIASVDKMLHHYHVENDPSRPWNGRPIIETNEYQEAIGHFNTGLELIEKYEEKLKAQQPKTQEGDS